MNEDTLKSYVAYAKGETIDDTIYPFVRDVLENYASGELKEKIVTEILGYTQSLDSIHGCDAFNNERPVEIKCETATPLSGRASWTSTNNDTKVQKLRDSDQEFVLAGWSTKGRLIYIISCNLNDTDIIDNVEEWINRCKIRTTNITPKTTHVQLGNAELDFKLINEKYIDGNINKNFLKKFPING